MFYLIATNNENVAETLKSFLEKEGTKPLVASDVESAVRALDSGKVDIFIVGTTGYSGFPAETLAETAKYLRSSTKVILVHEGPERRPNNFFDACFAIPFNSDKFHEKLKEFYLMSMLN